MLLSDFLSIRPPHETSQAETLDWLVAAHVQSEKMLGSNDESFAQSFREKLWRVGCKPDRIEKRGHILADFLHRDWDQMEIYRLSESATGKNLSARTDLFQLWAERIFEEYYPHEADPPSDLIHVSCTGYASPSGAQKIVSKRGWGAQTTVTHSYHMGCYGAFPAIRMGSGFLNSDPAKVQTDIVHTEICSLHSNPSLHQLDQLVSQSLFADGFIKYSIRKQTRSAHLKVIRILEEIIPHSTKAMTWDVHEWGFQMSLSKEVAVHITRHLAAYLKRLCIDPIQNAIYAIHPGGPKILLYIQELLNLSDKQMEHSFQILKEYGNMSSATIPHIWKRILEDPSIPLGTPIISMAFGPGLSISGSLMEKG